jgi:hypothetical protein
MRIFIGGVSELHRWFEVATHQTLTNQPYTWPVGHRTRPPPTLGIGYPCTDPSWHVGKAEIKMASTPGQSIKEVGPAGLTLARLGPGFVPRHPLILYYLWLYLILDILKICIYFGPYVAFPSSDVPEMVGQQNSWNSLVISTYLLYLAWNVSMPAINICIYDR